MVRYFPLLDGRVLRVSQVLGAEAGTTTDQSLLLLRTDRGQVDLSLQGNNDRDAMLIGFELLLLSSDVPAIGSVAVGNSEEQTPGESGANDGGLFTRSKSRRWDTSTTVRSGRNNAGGGGMVLESADEGSDDDDDGETRRNDPPPPSMSPLQKSWVKVE